MTNWDMRLCKYGHGENAQNIGYNGRCKQCAPVRVRPSAPDWQPPVRKYRASLRNAAWKQYGILNADGSRFTTVNFDHAYQIQSGKCVGCDTHQSKLKRALIPDHDHKTGIFRALLCNACNLGIGILQDDPARLRKLASFLDSHSASKVD